jgi:hypothetical protein
MERGRAAAWGSARSDWGWRRPRSSGGWSTASRGCCERWCVSCAGRAAPDAGAGRRCRRADGAVRAPPRRPPGGAAASTTSRCSLPALEARCSSGCLGRSRRGWGSGSPRAAVAPAAELWICRSQKISSFRFTL